MSIIIFGDLFDFPEGSAATNRVFSYAKGFTENGRKTYVVCFSNEYLEIHKGIIDGIEYYNPFEEKKRSSNFFVRRWKKVKKFFKTYRLLKKINKQNKITVINVWSNLFLTYFFAWWLSKIFKAKLIAECNEHPLRFYQRGMFNNIVGSIKLYIESRLSDGFFCISRFLIDFYQKKGVKQQKLFLVPSTVDPTRFSSTEENPLHRHFIGYFGGMTFKRDNIDLLIKAFARISSLHPEMFLVMGGLCRKDEKRKILDLIKSLKVEEKVQLIEYLPRQEIIKYISSASILVMTRSDDLQSQASYPSKLTEFLATGKPVITVNIGEISDYLTDNVDSFLVEPGNEKELADKMDFVLNNYEQAKEVGKKGKELTYGVFNYKYQTKRMISFIESLKK